MNSLVSFSANLKHLLSHLVLFVYGNGLPHRASSIIIILLLDFQVVVFFSSLYCMETLISLDLETARISTYCFHYFWQLTMMYDC